MHRRRFALGAVAASVAVVFTLPGVAFAAGATAHVVAGQMVIAKSPPELRALLTKWKSAFLHGTYFPDAVLKYAQGVEGGRNMKTSAEAASHGKSQSYCAPPEGFHHEFWTDYLKSCPPTPNTDDCARRFAFYFGILTHLITDGPWHGQFIDRTTKGKCAPCKSALKDKSGGKWCHPGGPTTWRERGTGDVVGGTSGRHMVADGDFDFCLAAALRGEPKDELVVQNPLLFAPATHVGKAGCPAKSFFDARNGGECWQCPEGTKRTLHAVDSDKACTTNLGGIETTTADYQGKRNFLKGCPDGQFANASLKHCYKCPGGYSHNPVLPVDKKGVCYRTGREKLASATFIRKQGLCGEGQFFDPRQGGECWACPSGYTRQVTSVTSDDACARPGKLRCSGLRAPAGTSATLPGFPTNLKLYRALSSSLGKAGANISEAILGQQMALFTGLFNGEGISAVRASAATPAAPLCPWILENAVSAAGGLEDSAAESAKFLAALWQHRAANVTVLRLDTYEYAIVDKNRRILYRNKWRDCTQDEDCGGGGSTCADGPGIRPESKKTCQMSPKCSP